ncbi:phage tail tape measure protein [Clostridium coskatii]|uniref:Chromosome partition protein Smc n=1 Tax=Clostridium coskatii TaxID=1705578 RepID=A0A166TTR4_9CLOT|nr:phage tail tape measure protein [Clostridium coskatii]OAA94081.1 Chromosome partition protein Smc [Clostridium coskatii]OBR96643.1 chromosome partition protein Smc [Clostridium coskatii]
MAENEEISSLAVRVALDDSSFSKGIQNLKRSLGTIDSEFKNSVAGIKDWGKNLDSLKSNAQSLGDKIETQRKIVQSYSEQLEKSKKTLEDNSKSMMELKSKVDSTKTAYEESKATLGSENEETKKLEKSLNDLTEKYKNNERTVLNNEKSVQGYTIQLNNAQSRLKGFEGQLDETNKKIANFKLTSLSTSLEETSKKFKSVGEGFSKAGDAALKFSIPVVAGIGVAAKAATSFEHQIADIRKEVEASGASTEKVNSIMSEMSQDSLQWSGDFGQSTDNINEGLLTLVKDGYSADESIKVMNTALYTSRGANEDLAVVVDQLGSSLEAYGMKTNDAAQTTQNMAHMADAFAYISNHTKASISSLGEAFSITGSTAYAMKIPMTQTAAAIGILESNGIDASTAANALKAGLVNLTKPTDQMSAAMKEMNLEVFDSKGNMKDLPALLNNIEKGTKGWTNEQKQAALAAIFGKESLATWNVLVHKGGDYLSDLSTHADNANGEVKKLSDSMKDTSANNFKELSASVHTLGVEFGQNVLPTLIPMVKETTNLVKAFGNLSPGMQKAIVDVAGFTLVAGVASKTIGSVVKGGSGILDFLGKHVKKSAEAKVASEAAGEGIERVGLAAAETGVETAGATAASGGLIASLGSVALAAGPYVLAIGGVVAAGVAVHHVMTEQAVPAVDLFADRTINDTEKASGSFKNLDSSIKSSTSSINTSVNKAGLDTTQTTIKISDATKKAVQSYIQMDDDVKKTMTDIYINADKFTDQTKKSVISQYTDMTNSTKILNTGMKTDSINQFKQMVSQTGNLTKDNVEKIVAKYSDMVNKVSGLTKQQKETMVKNFRDGLTQSVGITQQQVNTITQQITAMGTKIKEGMDKQSNDRYTTLKNFFDKSSALSTQDEQKILQNMQKDNNNKKQKITQYEAQITQIYQRASNNHRDLTVQEQQQVNSLQDKMKTNAVQSLSQNEIESKVILERIKSYGTSITEQQAQDIIKSANKQRDGAIAAANSQYDKVVADAIYQRDVSHTMTADQADKVIKNAGKQRDQSVQAAKDQRTQVVDHLSKMDGEVLSNMNTDTGNMLSPWETLISNIKKAWTDFKKWLSGLFAHSGSGDQKIPATGSIGSGNGLGGIPGLASGTDSASTGWHIVGEEGPELYYFAGGETVIDAKSTNKILSQVNKSSSGSSQNDSGEQLRATEEYGENLNKYFANGLESSISTVSKPLNVLQDSVNTLMTSFIQKYLSYGQQSSKNMGLGITQSSASAINPVNTLNKKIGTSVSNLTQSFTKYGQDSISNLGTGITGNESVANNAVNKVTDDNENILDAYSKVHTDYGTSSMDNLGTAITGNEGVVTDANTKVTTDNKAILSDYVRLHTTYGTNSMSNLTAGINSASSNVLSATNKVSNDNKNVLNNFAASANPIGQNVTNGLSEGMKSAEANAVSIAHELTQKVLDAFTGPDGFDIHSPSKKTTGYGENVIQGFINGMSKKDVLNFFKNKIGGMLNFAEGASGQIASWLTAALALTGQPMSALPALEQIAMHESGGNPMAINLWDSNATAGHPSKGLMQLIDDNMQYALPGMDNIWNPIDNAVAAIRYMIATYGSIWNVPGIRSMANGGSYVGYAAGTTNAVAGWRIVGENGPELEYSPSGGETILNASDTSKVLSANSSNSNGKTIGASLIKGIADGISSKISLISNAMSNIGKAASNAFGNSLKQYNAWDEFKNELAKALNDNEVYINNSVVKLNTVLANSVMNERNARSKYFEDYSKGVISSDAAVTKLDVDIKNLQTSTGDFETDTRNLLGVMTDQSTEINILTAEYNKLGAQYGYNSDKALDALKKIQDVKDAYQKSGTDILTLVDNLKKSEIDGINEVNDKIKDALKQRYQDEQDAAEKQVNLATDTQTKILQAKIDNLDQQESDLDIEYQDEDDADKRAELERQLSMHYGAAKKKELQEELDDLNKTEERRHQKESIAQQKDDLQKQIDQLKESNDNMIKNIEEFYSDKLKDANIDAEAQKMIINNNQSEIITLLKSYGKDYEITGSSLGDRFAAGFKSSLTSVSDMISNLKSQINDLNTNVNLSSISPLSTNVNNTVTSNIQQTYTAPKSIQSSQPIVIVTKTYLDGKQVAETSTPYIDKNLGAINALSARGL